MNSYQILVHYRLFSMRYWYCIITVFLCINCYRSILEWSIFMYDTKYLHLLQNYLQVTIIFHYLSEHIPIRKLLQYPTQIIWITLYCMLTVYQELLLPVRSSPKTLSNELLFRLDTDLVVNNTPSVPL